MQVQHNFPKDIIEIKDLFIDNGFKIYLAGGAVRDILLNITPLDYDLVTNALPNEIEQILIKQKIKHHRRSIIYGTFTTSNNIDIGSFMVDTPTIKFGCDMISDAGRRDLTFNAMYYDFENSTIIDYFGGIDDMNNKIIRMIGDPKIRLNADKFRSLRIIRYACKFDFDIPQGLFDAMKEVGINFVSYERIYNELKKSFIPNKFNKYLNLIYELGFANVIFGEFTNIDYGLIVNGNINEDSLAKCLSMLLGNEENLECKMRRSKYDNKLIKSVISISFTGRFTGK